MTLDGFEILFSLDDSYDPADWTSAAALFIQDSSVSLTVENCSFTGSGTVAGELGYALLATACDDLTVKNCTFSGFYMVMNFFTCTNVIADQNTVQNCDLFVHGEVYQDVTLTVTNNLVTGTESTTCGSLVGDADSTNLTLTLSGNTFTYAYFGLQNYSSVLMENYLSVNTYDHGYLVSETVDFSEKNADGWCPGTTTLMTVLPEGAFAAVWSVNSDTYPNQAAAIKNPAERTTTSITFSGYGSAVGYGYTTFSLNYLDAGSLTISKTVEGGDTDKDFTFTVLISTDDVAEATGLTLTGTYGDVELEDGVGTFTLSDGESVTISGLPLGAAYSVTETSAKGYTSAVSDGSWEGDIEEETFVSFTKYNKASTGNPPNLDISKSKEATELDENYESDVTLSLPSASYTGDLDVVFVLDGSTSTDEEDLVEQAAELLKSLLNYENLDVKAGVVIFGGSTPILYNSELLNLDDTNYSALIAEMTDEEYGENTEGKKGYGRSGSNLQAGVEIARMLLNSDTAVDESDKYMIILTDGGARTWYDSASGEAVSQTYQYGNGTTVGWNRNDDWFYRYGEYWEYYETNGVTVPSFSDVWADGQSGETIGNYAMTKSQYETASVGDEGVASWSEALTGAGYYSTYEAACYYAATSIVAASDESHVIMVTYPYYSGTSYTKFTDEFKTWLESYVTRYESSDAEAETIFADVEDELIQLVAAGSVIVDEIGDSVDAEGIAYDFDFVNDIDCLTLTVDGTALSVTQIDEYTYGFGSATGSSDGTTYPYVLTYYPNGTTYQDTSYEECFILQINVPVTKNNQVQLTYRVKLTNPQTTAGVYGSYDQYGENNDGSSSYSLYTNNVARLYPVDSEGNSGTPEDFSKPTVSYTVTSVTETSEAETTTDTPEETSSECDSSGEETEESSSDSDSSGTDSPEDEDTDPDDEDSSDADADSSETGDTDADAASTDTPETGDDSHLALWCVLFLLAVAGITGLAIYGQRQRK
ncbi:MAG: DUF5979 domain-containing protein [Lachnospiraceae bacterium]|nr:DUF5979 domain-containing protein [Lachnospiraceae bacterium]